MSAADFLAHYKKKDFNFSNKVLTKYCLSLYTKPFLILSGISGTGKTKIAQLFEVYNEDAAAPEEPSSVIPPGSRYISMNLTHTLLKGDGRGNFKVSDLGVIFESDEMPEIKRKIEEFRKKGVDDNITEPELFTIETEEGEFKATIYLQRAFSPLLRVRFISKKGEREKYNSQDFLNTHYKEGDVLKFQKTGKHRLRVISVNDQLTKAIHKKLEKEETKLINNKLFIAVKSNWTDNTELFGFYNILEEKYNLTPVLKFILTAKEHPDKPFFLILDEMNLSKVEHYFSDFLSCLESRTIDNGVIKQEEMRLHNYSSFVDSNDNYFDSVPNSVEIPLNLYVTGTVNIDETTYAFSPKVLDRANVIEFNEVNISAYHTEPEQDRFTLAKFPKFGVAQIATSQSFSNSPQAYKQCVSDLLDILQPYNLHFGYRVINEMASFINHAVTYIGNQPGIIEDAIDIQISQKILPKFSGSFGKLDEPLRKLIEYMAGDDAITYKDITIDYLSSIDAMNTSFPESLPKICRLYTNLMFNGFASFLE